MRCCDIEFCYVLGILLDLLLIVLLFLTLAGEAFSDFRLPSDDFLGRGFGTNLTFS